MHAPWTPPDVPEIAWDAIEREALRVNDRYLSEIVEGYAFCPFAKDGREKGRTARYVHRSRGNDGEALLALFALVAATPEQEVAQVILPLVDVDPKDFATFCYALTELGNARARVSTLACAPLHPALPFSTATPYTLLPLFRRAPDPTIQWVRLDGLDAIYAGRTTETICPTPEELALIQRADAAPRAALYDRVCDTNSRMAERIGVARLEGMLRDIAEDGRRSYGRALRGSSPSTRAEARPSRGARSPR